MRILYVTTTFPVYSETFLQREVRALKELGADLRILSLHEGDSEFEGIEIDRFSKWELMKLLWLLPWLVLSRFKLFRKYLGDLLGSKPSYWLNFWENMLGLGAAIVRESSLREEKPAIIHCVWSSAAAAFGWLESRLVSVPFSMGAHAYDVFEKGGDWLLRSKARDASFIHTSTNSAAMVLKNHVSSQKVHLIRRGMNRFPDFKRLRTNRHSLRIVCVARLVEKKGFPFQLAIYEALRTAGVIFEARIIGEGEMRKSIQSGIHERGLEDCVTLRGKLSLEETLENVGWADILIHTGVVARNGDRDGLPNVIPEAMASGTVVLGSPVSGVVEAIADGETGFLCDVENASAWVSRCRLIQSDDGLCETLRLNARNWVEREFLASRNSGRLLQLLVQHASS